MTEVSSKIRPVDIRNGKGPENHGALITTDAAASSAGPLEHRSVEHLNVPPYKVAWPHRMNDSEYMMKEGVMQRKEAKTSNPQSHAIDRLVCGQH